MCQAASCLAAHVHAPHCHPPRLRHACAQDGPLCHVASAVGAGFCAVCVGSPVDVVKSRIMGDKEGQYKGVVDCFVKTLRDAGVAGLYKGFVPNFGRLAAWNTVMFLTLEQLKKIAAEALA